MRQRILFLVTFALFAIIANAQKIIVNPTKAEKEGRIRVTTIKNNYDFDVDVIFCNKYDGKETPRRIKANESLTGEDITCTSIKVVSVDKTKGVDETVWAISKTKAMWAKQEKEETSKQEPITKEEQKLTVADNKKSDTKPVVTTPQLPKAKKDLNPEQIIEKFKEYLDEIPFLSESGVADGKLQIDKYVKELENWANIDSCIANNNLAEVTRLWNDSLETYKDEASRIVYDFSKQFNADANTNEELTSIINDRIEQRESDLNRLECAMSVKKEEASSDLDWKVIGNCAVIGIIVLLLIIWIVRANKKKGKKTAQATPHSSAAAPGIVVRRTTTSILKKQSLEDVIDNPAYLKIDCADFCSDSAVRRIYLKNTCVKDIYNMYADDLRNPNNPKEDGCMVLGRWVFDKEANEYYVSLEHIVRPGDDAVFSEYELNFGGKIKLRVAEKLRKLRRDTGLQYDMTCWVHSHPGLGVFFSNSDNNVQMQLKHPTHPHFLTAIVVDILTPEQELGIFTFKKDGTVNAKADLTKMYLLEKLYKWAVDSDRNTFKEEDYYNSLGKASKHYYDCAEVQLSNGSIIDMSMLVEGQASGMMAFVHGFRSQLGSKTRFVANAVSRHEAVPDNEKIGCFINAAHCSIPSIRKAVANHLKEINFVIVASASDGMLTTIPVLNGELCGDTNYYGEENFEDLKIWTRRKR